MKVYTLPHSRPKSNPPGQGQHRYRKKYRRQQGEQQDVKDRGPGAKGCQQGLDVGWDDAGKYKKGKPRGSSQEQHHHKPGVLFGQGATSRAIYL